jgi:hypothetical protein
MCVEEYSLLNSSELFYFADTFFSFCPCHVMQPLDVQTPGRETSGCEVSRLSDLRI